MAKDPAFLWYPSDYVTGTMHLDFECKGAYVDLLMLQFQKGHMTQHMIKQVLGHRYEHIWSLIFDKFVEEDGKFYNQRLRVEKEKRAMFCKSRKNNRNGGSHMLKHMSRRMEDVNIYKNTDQALEIVEYLEKGGIEISKSEKKYFMFLVSEMAKRYTDKMPGYFFDKQTDYHACLQIAYLIAKANGWQEHDVLNGKMEDCLEYWDKVIDLIQNDAWLKIRPLAGLSTVKEWQGVVLKLNRRKGPKNASNDDLEKQRERVLKLQKGRNDNDF